MSGDITFLTPKGHTRHWDEVSRKLWEENFDDSEKYCDFYFRKRWRDSSAFFLGKVSMMHLCPYTLNFEGREFSGVYLVGVCTEEGQRRKGYMARLLSECYAKLYQNNVPFLYLMPADTKIYEPFGFREFYEISPYSGSIGYAINLYQNKRTKIQKTVEDSVLKISADGTEDGKFKILVKEYRELSEGEEYKISEFANRRLIEKVQCFVKRDDSYFELRSEEMEGCRGRLLTFWCEDITGNATLTGEEYGDNRALYAGGEIPIGYAMLMREEGAEISEFIVEDGFEHCALSALESVLTEDERRNVIFCETMFLGELPGVEKKLLMGRIINLENFMSLLRKTVVSERLYKTVSGKCCIYGKNIFGNSIYLDIDDGVITHNSGLWELTTDGDIIKSAKSAGNVRHCGDIKLTIEEFFGIVVKNCKFYLNEMV